MISYDSYSKACDEIDELKQQLADKQAECDGLQSLYDKEFKQKLKLQTEVDELKAMNANQRSYYDHALEVKEQLKERDALIVGARELFKANFDEGSEDEFSPIDAWLEKTKAIGVKAL